MSDPNTVIFDLLQATTGVKFTAGRKAIVLRRIQERREQLSGVSPEDYSRRLAIDTAEREQLAQAAMVPETFFFRHPQQFQVLSTSFLPSMLAAAERENRPLMVWSAGCSRGCEPFTMAILLADARAEILGSDISLACLEEARRGIYTQREVTNETPPTTVARHFTQQGPDRYLISPRLASRVRFQPVNLLSDPLPGGCDIVLCRNVLYYMSDDARDAILKRIWSAMRPGGILLLSPTETAADRPAYYTPVDRDLRIYRAWTTGLGATSGGNGLALSRRKDGEVTVCLPRELGRPRDLDSLASILARESVDEATTLVLDATQLRWISNHALHELRLILLARAGRSRRAIVLIVRSREHKTWFETAELDRLLTRIQIDGVPQSTDQIPVLDSPRHVFELELPREASGANLDEIQRLFDRALKETRDHHDGAIVINAAVCRFIDEQVALLLSRFIRSAAACSHLQIKGASPALKRFLTPYIPEDVLR